MPAVAGGPGGAAARVVEKARSAGTRRRVVLREVMGYSLA
jgi:hypothetical protein